MLQTLILNGRKQKIAAHRSVRTAILLISGFTISSMFFFTIYVPK